MTYYRWAWRTCWVALALALALVGLVVGSVGAVLVTAVLTGLFAAVAAAALLQNDGGLRVPVAQQDKVAARFGVRAGVAAGVISAWTPVVGALVLPLLVVAALTSPPVVGVLLVWRWRRGSPGAVPDDRGCACGCADPVSIEEMRVLLALLSDAELVRAWRHSLARLRQAGTSTEWAGLVVLRTACLAELDSLPAAATAPDLSRPPPR